MHPVSIYFNLLKIKVPISGNLGGFFHIGGPFNRCEFFARNFFIGSGKIPLFMNIILLGYRGTGKSVISRILAQKLKRKLIPIDKEIARSAGMPISQIVQQWGWPRFREIESRIIREVSAKECEAVIDCGGGVVLDDQNIACLKKQGRTALLRADLQTLMKRIKNDPNRPPLKEGLSFEEEQKIIMAEREPKYLSAADMICDTTSKKPVATAREIIEFFQMKSWI